MALRPFSSRLASPAWQTTSLPVPHLQRHTSGVATAAAGPGPTGSTARGGKAGGSGRGGGRGRSPERGDSGRSDGGRGSSSGSGRSSAATSRGGTSRGGGVSRGGGRSGGGEARRSAPATSGAAAGSGRGPAAEAAALNPRVRAGAVCGSGGGRVRGVAMRRAAHGCYPLPVRPGIGDSRHPSGRAGRCLSLAATPCSCWQPPQHRSCARALTHRPTTRRSAHPVCRARGLHSRRSSSNSSSSSTARAVAEHGACTAYPCPRGRTRGRCGGVGCGRYDNSGFDTRVATRGGRCRGRVQLAKCAAPMRVTLGRGVQLVCVCVCVGVCVCEWGRGKRRAVCGCKQGRFSSPPPSHLPTSPPPHLPTSPTPRRTTSVSTRPCTRLCVGAWAPRPPACRPPPYGWCASPLTRARPRRRRTPAAEAGA